MCTIIKTACAQSNLTNLIRVEQEILTGVTEDGKEVSTDHILKLMKGIKQHVNDGDYARLVMLFLSCYHMPA
jgi:hypothetical protein